MGSEVGGEGRIEGEAELEGEAQLEVEMEEGKEDDGGEVGAKMTKTLVAEGGNFAWRPVGCLGFTRSGQSLRRCPSSTLR